MNVVGRRKFFQFSALFCWSHKAAVENVINKDEIYLISFSARELTRLNEYFLSHKESWKLVKSRALMARSNFSYFLRVWYSMNNLMSVMRGGKTEDKRRRKSWENWNWNIKGKRLNRFPHSQHFDEGKSSFHIRYTKHGMFWHLQCSKSEKLNFFVPPANMFCIFFLSCFAFFFSIEFNWLACFELNY